MSKPITPVTHYPENNEYAIDVGNNLTMWWMANEDETPLCIKDNGDGESVNFSKATALQLIGALAELVRRMDSKDA